MIPIRSMIVTIVLVAGTGPVSAQDVTGVTDPRDGYPDISPDGQRIVFQSNRSGTWQLWLVDIDGSGLQRLTHTGANDVTPVWSPDGTRIMFASDRTGGAHRGFDPAESFDARDIYVMDVSGGPGEAEATVRRIVGTRADEMHPEWANAGRSVVFNRVNDSQDGADIVITDIDGERETVVDTLAGWNTYAALAPDDGRLVYRGTTEETLDGETVQNSDVFSSRVDGSNRKRLTESAAFDGWPAISPDGKTIAFASNRSGDAFHIYLMPIDGGEMLQVTSGSRFHYTQPAWSPDGRRLAAFRWQADGIGEVGHVVLLDVD